MHDFGQEIKILSTHDHRSVFWGKIGHEIYFRDITDRKKTFETIKTNLRKNREKQEPCSGVWGYPPPENFPILRHRNAIFSTCHEIWLRKIDLEYENSKQLQVTTIKITESNENKSIHRLNLSGSTGRGGGGGPLPPCPPAIYGSHMVICTVTCTCDLWPALCICRYRCPHSNQ